MKRAKLKQAGFTIVETMFFLAITGALVASALLIFNSRISNTQFTQSVQELDNQIKGVINDVAAGTYPTNPPYTCTVGANGPVVTAGASGQGTNTSCMFLGKSLQFNVGGGNTKYNVYTIAGRRAVNNTAVTSLTGADGALSQQIDGLVPDTVNLTSTHDLRWGISVTKMAKLNTDGTVASNIGAVAILQTLGSYSGGTDPRLNSGSQTIQTWPLGSEFPATETVVHAAVGADRDTTFAQSNANPAGGVLICLNGGGANQKANIILGSNKGTVTTTVSIGSDSRC